MRRIKESFFKGTSKLADFRDALISSNKFTYSEDFYSEYLHHKKSGMLITLDKNEDPDFGPLSINFEGKLKGLGFNFYLEDDEIKSLTYTPEAIDVVLKMPSEPYITFDI